MRYCPNCGEPVPDDAPVCSACGADAEPAASGNSGKYKPALLAGAAVAVVALVVALAIFVTGTFSSPVQNFLTCNAQILSSGGESLAQLAEIAGGRAEGRVGVYLPYLDFTLYLSDLGELIQVLTGAELAITDSQTQALTGTEVAKILTPYMEILAPVFTKESITAEKSQTVYMNGPGTSPKCTVYTFRPDADTLEPVLAKLGEQLSKDDGLRELLTEYLHTGAGMIMNIFYIGERRPVYEYNFYPGYDYKKYDLEELVNTFLDVLPQELNDNAAGIARSIVESGFTWSVAVEGDDACQVRFSFEDSTNGETTIVLEKYSNAPGRLTHALYADDAHVISLTVQDSGADGTDLILSFVPYD